VVLLVADDPTIYDLATAAIALLGRGLSAYSIRRLVKRETRSVELSCRYGFPVGPISSVAPDELICVEVVNEGHRPVEVTGVGFQLKDGRQPLVMPLPLEGPVHFPRTLSDGGVRAGARQGLGSTGVKPHMLMRGLT
jgi:hypothetical protein